MHIFNFLVYTIIANCQNNIFYVIILTWKQNASGYEVFRTVKDDTYHPFLLDKIQIKT